MFPIRPLLALLLVAIASACARHEQAPATFIAAPTQPAQEDTTPKSIADVPPDKALVYRIDLVGEFGHEVSQTPVKQLLEEAREWQPDVLLVYLDLTFVPPATRPEEPSWATVYNQLETARHLQTLLTDGVRDEPRWRTRDGKKPELVMWVKRALGGAALLPFNAPKIYYASTARHGGAGSLEYAMRLFDDPVTRQRSYSLRMARAEGLALKGGHDPKLVRAMWYRRYVLSVSFVDGKPVFYEDETGDELLTDDGDAEHGRQDSWEQIIAGEGNDYLNLNAALALRLGLSSGTVDTEQALIDKLGLSNSSVVIHAKAAEKIGAWGVAVFAAQRDIDNAWRELERTPIPGNTAAERNRGRERQIQLAKQILTLYRTYEEAIDRRQVRAPASDEIEIIIEQIKMQTRQDR